MGTLLILRQILFAETFLFDGFNPNFIFAYDHFTCYHSSPNFTPLDQSAQMRLIQPVLAGGFGNRKKCGKCSHTRPLKTAQRTQESIGCVAVLQGWHPCLREAGGW